MMLGALRDPPGTERGERLSGLAAVRDLAAMPYSVDLRHRVTRIPEQRGQSCVGHALAQALRVRSVIQGSPIDPSATAIYATARSAEDPRAKRLRDVGSYPSLAIAGLNDWGVVAHERWTDDADLYAPVTQDVREAGALAYVTGEYRIGDAEREVELRKALAADHPVFWCRDVDKPYMQHRGGLYGGLTADVEGGHAGCLVGFDGECVTDAGSWGYGHGEDGFARISWDFVLSAHAYAFYVITFAPLEVR